MSVIEEIKNRINAMNDSEIFMTSDFADLSSITTIRKSLGRCCDDKIIRRVFDADIIMQLQKRLSESDKEIILCEAINCGEWIYETIRKICMA